MISQHLNQVPFILLVNHLLGIMFLISRKKLLLTQLSREIQAFNWKESVLEMAGLIQLTKSTFMIHIYGQLVLSMLIQEICVHGTKLTQF